MEAPLRPCGRVCGATVINNDFNPMYQTEMREDALESFVYHAGDATARARASLLLTNALLLDIALRHPQYAPRIPHLAQIPRGVCCTRARPCRRLTVCVLICRSPPPSPYAHTRCSRGCMRL
eukprot:jgi/Tetstr1/464734/TSEL_009481.t1